MQSDTKMVLKQQQFLKRPWKCCVPADTFKVWRKQGEIWRGKDVPYCMAELHTLGGGSDFFLCGNFWWPYINCLLFVCWWMGAGFLLRILWCSQSGNHPEINLAKFGLPTRYESRKEMESFYIFGYLPWNLSSKSGKFESFLPWKILLLYVEITLFRLKFGEYSPAKETLNDDHGGSIPGPPVWYVL